MGKEEYAKLEKRARDRRAKIDYLLKGPQPNSWSATMPAYAYTCICPDPDYRRQERTLWKGGADARKR